MGPLSLTQQHAATRSNCHAQRYNGVFRWVYVLCVGNGKQRYRLTKQLTGCLPFTGAAPTSLLTPPLSTTPRFDHSLPTYIHHTPQRNRQRPDSVPVTGLPSSSAGCNRTPAVASATINSCAVPPQQPAGTAACQQPWVDGAHLLCRQGAAEQECAAAGGT